MHTTELTNGSTSGLEEAKHEVHGQDEEVAELFGKADEVEPKAHIDEEEAGTASEQADGKDGGGVEGVAKLAADNVADGVSLFSGGSGRAFKFAPTIGDMMASLVTGDESPVDLAPFSAKREALAAEQKASPADATSKVAEEALEPVAA